MALNFTTHDEVRLQEPPLTEVICQVRFPPILRIGQERPVAFQELVRREFPNLETEQSMILRVPSASLGMPSAEPAPTTYRFLTTDRNTVISLAPDFYSLSTTTYQHWEGFRGFLELANNAVREVYEPSHAARIGLRYINKLTIENTHSEDAADMLRKLRPELTALITTDAWSDPREMRTRLLLTNDDDGRLTLQMRFAEEEGLPFFSLDFDYFDEGEMPLEGMVERCNGYQQIVYDAFRWCVPDETLQAFGIVG